MFPYVLLELQYPDFKLLTWMAEDVAAYTEEARTLGAPLEAGEQHYTDIQKSPMCVVKEFCWRMRDARLAQILERGKRLCS